MHKIYLFYFLTLSLLVSSCGLIHNLPNSQNPNRIESPNISYSFVDQNGNFYPDNWRKAIGAPKSATAKQPFSLMKVASDKGANEVLQRFERQNMLQLSKRVANKKRVFIFIHGFNADAASTQEHYQYMANLIQVNANQDEIIRFYWDGLKSNSPFRSAKNWFSAASFSQMAGEFGLRRILNNMADKDVYLISHSRGASVVMSALSNPQYNEKFAEQAKDIHNVDIERAKPLLENKNRITCIMLAPAIGLTEFQYKDTVANELKFVTLSPQVKKIHITVNSTDKMLKKFFGFLANKLNPTDLGYKEDTYNELIKHYKIFSKTDFTGMESHEFNRYIRNPKFKDMLKDENIKTK
ncbi:alpha/beta hydrolase [Sphingobacteriaceae bacterium WQ 2009]|uniref:Alpha/beta hydrolase n=1 Tax=Rhinopithecimicrobium faecis TaxID=2820698 RepID=A0A8T4HGK5_9SPHI|nr:alpha/beta hydrolase [Sphingobacteriaceae bacterium WQ 2009]